MINVLLAVLFGIVQGLTEWVPISSTAHMLLLKNFVPFNVTPEFYEVFEVVIQLGAAIALFIVFFNKIWPFGKTSNPLGPFKFVKKDVFMLLLKLAVACIPVIAYKLVIEDLLNLNIDTYLCIGISLIVVGVAFIVLEAFLKDSTPKMKTTREITFKAAFIIGLFQLIAGVFPGVSRSGATIIGAMLIGVSRSASVDFSFELAIPAMLGASLWEVLKHGMTFTGSEIIILVVGAITAFAVSFFVIKTILNYIRTHSFTGFGIYRIVLGIVVLVLFFTNVL